jgi:alpha-tubulin suppressor-like RCC1 family protein
VVAVAAAKVHTFSNTGRSHTVGLTRGGTVPATGWNDDGQCDVANWSDVVGIAAGWHRTMGWRGDGTVVAAGRANEGACAVEGWREIVALACGDWHSVGVCSDGTAVATGINRRGQCAVSGWTGLTGHGRVIATGDNREVVMVAAGSRHTLGLCAVETLLAAGCNDDGHRDVAGWGGMAVP